MLGRRTRRSSPPSAAARITRTTKALAEAVSAVGITAAEAADAFAQMFASLTPKEADMAISYWDSGTTTDCTYTLDDKQQWLVYNNQQIRYEPQKFEAWGVINPSPTPEKIKKKISPSDALEWLNEQVDEICEYGGLRA